MTDSLISISGLCHERGEKELYGGIDFSIDPGEIVQVAGPNGHGKSTLLRILAGLIHPDTGERQWRSKTFSSWEDETPAPIIWLGERPGWAGHHSVQANWRYLRAMRGLSSEMTNCWIDESWWPKRFESLSTGQRKRTALGFIEVSQARLWLLDEPLSGLDSAMSSEWQTRMQRAAETGVAIAIVSHEELFCTTRHFVWDSPPC